MSVLSSFFRTSKKQKIQTGLFIQISSGSVGAGIGTYAAHDRPEFIYTTQTSLGSAQRSDMSTITEAAGKALDIVLNDVLTKGMPQVKLLKHFDTIVITLASPWIISRTKVISYKKEQPFSVNRALLKNFVEKALQETQHENTDVAGAEKIEQTIIQSLLQGYPVTHAEGKRVKDIKVSVFESFAPPQALQRFRDSVAGVFHRSDVIFQSFPLVSYHTLHALFPDRDSYIFLDIAEEITDISLVTENTLLETHSFPGGSAGIAKAGSVTGDIPSGKAAVSAHFIGVTKKEIPTDEKPTNHIAAAANAWAVSFCKALTALHERHALPHTLFILTEQKSLEWFSHIIENQDFTPSCHTEHPFEIVVITPELLQKYVTLGGAGSTFNPYISLPLLFFHTTHKK